MAFFFFNPELLGSFPGHRVDLSLEAVTGSPPPRHADTAHRASTELILVPEVGGGWEW